MGSLLISSHHPSGRANLILSVDTGPYLGKIVKKIPFIIDNPYYRKPVAPLQVTKGLMKKHGTSKVVELFHEKPLPDWQIPTYDGVRDVYLGDGRDAAYNGSCTNHGSGFVYGSDLRYRLHLGGESRRILIKYDLSMLPKETLIERAFLALKVTSLNKKQDLNCQAFALKKRFHEQKIGSLGGFACHYARMGQAKFPVGTVEGWEKPFYQGMSDRYPSPVAEFEIKEKGWMTIDISQAAQNWVSGRWRNHGLAIEPRTLRKEYGKHDVFMHASDYSVHRKDRPRLILAFKKPPMAVTPEIREKNAAALLSVLKGNGSKGLTVVNVLSNGSLTCRKFEKDVLRNAHVQDFLSKHFQEVRINHDRADVKAMLKPFGVKRAPTTLVIGRKDKDGDIPFEILEPYDWDCVEGIMRTDFEFEQMYTDHLNTILKKLSYKKSLAHKLAASAN